MGVTVWLRAWMIIKFMKAVGRYQMELIMILKQ